jgi:hypothetical protein
MRTRVKYARKKKKKIESDLIGNRALIPNDVNPQEEKSLEPTINLKTHLRKPNSSLWKENLDSLRTHFKNLDYIKI